MEFWQGGPVVLAEESLKRAIRGKRIAMMVNSSAIHNDGRFLMDIIVEEKWADVAFFLGIEHGIRNDLENEHDNLGKAPCRLFRRAAAAAYLRRFA